MAFRSLWFESVWQDVRFALRGLRRSPSFLIVSMISLALGIGVNVSVFSFVDALFLRPPPGVSNPSELVTIQLRSRSTGGSTGASYQDFEYLQQRAASFSGIVAFTSFPMTIRAGDLANSVRGELVSDTYFQVLGVQPEMGRMLDARDAQSGSDLVVVLAYDAWKQRFGGDPGVIGRTIRLGSAVVTVVGITPKGFQGLVFNGPESPAIWIPARLYAQAVPSLADSNLLVSWRTQTFDLAARLKPATGLRQAEAEMAAIESSLDRARTAGWTSVVSNYTSLTIGIVSGREGRIAPENRATVVRVVVVLAAIAVVIFLVACLNVANLILVRVTRRQQEFVLRMSLGAGRLRLLRQLFAENLTLATIGALVCLPIADWTSRVLVTYGRASPASLTVDPGIDARVAAFAGLAAIMMGVLLTMLPAAVVWHAHAGRGIGSHFGRIASRLRSHGMLVAAQVSLSVVLLMGAGLFVRTVMNALAVDVTVRSDHVLLARLDPAAADYRPDRGARVYSDLLDRIRALPGVIDAAAVFVVPLGGRRGGTNIVLPAVANARTRTMQVGFNVVSTRYFETIGVPIVAGRAFTNDDRPGSMPVAVINEVMAERVFVGRNPIGQQFVVKRAPERSVEVVGIARDGRFRNHRSDIEPTVYLPLGQQYVSAVTLEVRTVAHPMTLVPAIRRELAAIDRDLPLTNIETARRHFDQTLWQERLTATLLAGLAALALVLAASGIYGVLSYAVAQRIPEIGLRMALGARQRSIVSMVLTPITHMVMLGTGVGAVCVWVATRFVRGLLYGVSPTDPWTFSASALTLLAVALLAGFWPAWRAARIDPAVALRSE